ncbi:ribosome maturation factor RimM [Cohnella candidum]|uniref:Ribosome maturation factor RimM n=1 Tax=Cohnella candidum TaxID=2674991 RepID=A0A3G3JVS4_9BACL|nr:ribosome maturation factor RimM [Cohnella candidum]AYQ71957.1 ribosome maturation factor RimM [Cohnella candidum]
MTEERLLNVGTIVNTHGVKGEVRVWPQTDFPELRFKPGSKLLLVPPEAGNPSPVEIQSSREQKNVYVLKLKGIDDMNGAEKLKGWGLKVTETERAPLDEGEYYVRDIVGCMVVTEDGETLGTVSDVLTPGANDVWVVKRATGKELLLPVIDDVVLEVDVASKRIKVHLMEGLL